MDSSRDLIKTNSIGDLHINTVTKQITLYEKPNLSTQALIGIKDTLESMTGGINMLSSSLEMLGIIVFICLTFGLGFFTDFKLSYFFSGLLIIWLGILLSTNMTLTDSIKGHFYKFGAYGFYLMGFLVSLLGVLLFIERQINIKDSLNNKKNNKYNINSRENFYPKY
jgi:hypothetical protein